jgi:anti-sigma B factor antagonist
MDLRSLSSPIVFRVDVCPERDRVRVAPVGELDLACAGMLDARLRELRDAGFDWLVLDLRRLEFIDSTGIRVVVAHDTLARRDGSRFSLIGGPPGVRRAFELCGMLERLDFLSA